MYSIKAIAEHYGVHVQSVYRWVWAKQLAAIKIGGIWRVTSEALQAFEQSSQQLARPAWSY